MGHVVAFSPWSLVQIDLLDMQKYSFDYSKYKPKKKLDGVKTNFNKGFKYIMIMIDVFTRYVDVVMLKSKNIEDCVHALKIMLDFNGVNILKNFNKLPGLLSVVYIRKSLKNVSSSLVLISSFVYHFLRNFLRLAELASSVFKSPNKSSP
jgi:hypothetical protein